ncbi:outer membrane beta-barrel protein [Hymenobacter cellulosivorans]|uniref:Outer membrane beta-barrel protein n=1 Tax=Hymenobacter cellulosivorans TaxID=2932249 RepID=A0ABY4FD44_9BACT|nr:outer membrane beta-barrel protein [Hymenobacter cellulosivorans]UOQ54388.1 outer membrane beta-barrel protein [Hymenobacter cellulosivorans]
MKTLFATGFIVLAAAAGASAQTEKGSLMVGTSLSQLSYSTSRGGYSKQFSIGITPTVGFFVVDRLALGAEVNLAYSTFRYGGFPSSKARAFEYRVAPFARYYVVEADKHKFFGQASYGITGFSTRTTDELQNSFERKSKGSYSTLAVSVGYDYFISPMVALEVQPYYLRNSTQLQGARTNNWGVSVGLQIFFPKTAAAAQ